jgi:hypothetical protein
MSDNNGLFRIAGIAGILGALLMLAMSLVIGTAGAGASPSVSPLSTTLSLLSVVAGIILVVGLFVLYRGAAGALSLAAFAISLIGYLLFAVATITKAPYPSPVLTAGDILVYIVGVALFSWLALRTGKLPRALAIAGFLAALTGVVSYLLVFGTGATMENPTPVLTVFYFLYLVLAVIWLFWTGLGLLRRKPEAAPAP